MWLRKCKVHKYHTALCQYEFVYTCGYSRHIPIADVQEITHLHKGYSTNTNAKIVDLVRIAEEQWNAVMGVPQVKKSKRIAQSKRNSTKAKTAPKTIAAATSVGIEANVEYSSNDQTMLSHRRPLI